MSCSGDGLGGGEPRKLINVPADMAAWNVSQAHTKLESVMALMSKTVAGHSVPSKTSNAVGQGLIDLFAALAALADEVEPLKEKQRFGNMAYRTWHDRMAADLPELVAQLKLQAPDVMPELLHYLGQSFGSKQRLDFGTGHELNFVAFFGALLGLELAGAMSGSDILAVFYHYYELCGKIILRYNLEPAGSHGVWGLDDHFHFVYVLGSAQLAFGSDDGRLSPKDVLNKSITAHEAGQNLYFWAVNFIHTVKRGNFFEHSPLLNDIANVPSWSKIHRGMTKMYNDEVFGKFPVMQHFWFGTIYTLEVDSTRPPPPEPKKTTLPPTSMPPPSTR